MLRTVISDDCNTLTFLSITRSFIAPVTSTRKDNDYIEHEALRIIINDNIATWKTALSNVKGIYLITDRLTRIKTVFEK